MEPIVLSGKRELDIYVNPQRQNLLRCMKIAGVPMTPKQIADRMGISPSSVQHHIRKLAELGIVELSHTERIHGITASYYRALPRTVSIGGPGRGGLQGGAPCADAGRALPRVRRYAAYCERNSPAPSARGSTAICSPASSAWTRRRRSGSIP